MYCSNMNYKVRDKCQMEPYKILARQLCPRTCATCCLTKEYNCDNGNDLKPLLVPQFLHEWLTKITFLNNFCARLIAFRKF